MHIRQHSPNTDFRDPSTLRETHLLISTRKENQRNQVMDRDAMKQHAFKGDTKS